MQTKFKVKHLVRLLTHVILSVNRTALDGHLQISGNKIPSAYWSWLYSRYVGEEVLKEKVASCTEHKTNYRRRKQKDNSQVQVKDVKNKESRSFMLKSSNSSKELIVYSQTKNDLPFMEYEISFPVHTIPLLNSILSQMIPAHSCTPFKIHLNFTLCIF